MENEDTINAEAAVKNTSDKQTASSTALPGLPPCIIENILDP